MINTAYFNSLQIMFASFVMTTAVIADTSPVLADDGVPGFLSAIFGGGNETASAPAPRSAPAPEPETSRPAHRRRIAVWSPAHVRALVVHLHKPAARILTVQAPTKPERVSILTDSTLRSGDMVMTAQGIRVFQGAPAAAHSRADFVTLATARSVDPTVVKQVSPLDRLPRI